MKKNLLIILFTIMFVSILAACGGNSDQGDSDKTTEEDNKEATNDQDTYVVATDNGYVPFEYIDEETNELVGFDIDLMTALAEEANIDIEFQTLEFDGIVAGIGSGRFDIAIAGMGITEERKESIDFSEPYYHGGLILAVQQDDDEIKSIEDIDGKSVATRTGSTSQEYLTKNTDANIEAFPGIIEGYQNVIAGRADAILYDLPNVQYYTEKEAKGELKTVGERLTSEDYGIGFPKGSDLRDKVDDALKTLKENGKYDDIYEEWFGERPEGT